MFSFGINRSLIYHKIEYANIDDLLPNVGNIAPQLKSGKYWSILPTIGVGVLDIIFNSNVTQIEYTYSLKGTLNPYVNINSIENLQRVAKIAVKISMLPTQTYVIGNIDFPCIVNAMKAEAANQSRKIEYLFTNKSPYCFIS